CVGWRSPEATMSGDTVPGMTGSVGSPGVPPVAGQASPVGPGGAPPAAPGGLPPVGGQAGPVRPGGGHAATVGPGGATPVPGPGDLVRAFLRSPFQPETWLATAAIVLGIGIAVVAAALLSFLFSTGGSLLIWLVGIPIIALGLELSRG